MATHKTPKKDTTPKPTLKPKPKPKPKRRKKTMGRPPKGWKPNFVTALAERGVVLFACKKAGVSRATAYAARNQKGLDEQSEAWLEAATFTASWEDAVDEAADRMEVEAFRRGHNGFLTPRTIAGEPVFVREYSDTLLIFLLKGARPHKYRENLHHSGVIGSRALVLADADQRKPEQDPVRDPDLLAALEGASRPRRPQDGKNGDGSG